MATFYGQFDSIHARHKLQVDGTSLLKGATTITGALTQTGAVALASTLSVAGAVTFDTTLGVTGITTLTESLNATKTDVTAPANTIYAVMDLGVSYSAGSANAVKGYVTSDAPAGQTVRNMAAGWFGLNWTSAFAATGAGVTRGVNVEVTNSAVGSHPNAVLYLQSVAGTSASNATMPYIVMTDSGAGTQSNIMFELGHEAAGQTVTTGSGTLVYNQTLQIKVNTAAAYIPYSTAEGTYTTAYPIVTTSTITQTIAALGNNVRGASYNYNCATPAMGDGVGAHEINLNVGGIAGGNAAASSAWINIPDAGDVGLQGAYICARTDGIYEASAGDVTDAILIFGAKMTAQLGDTDFGRLAPFCLNSDQDLSALFVVSSTDSKMGMVVGTSGMATQAGSIKGFIDSNGRVFYIKLYDEAAS